MLINRITKYNQQTVLEGQTAPGTHKRDVGEVIRSELFTISKDDVGDTSKDRLSHR